MLFAGEIHLMEYLTFFRKYTLWNISLSLGNTPYGISHLLYEIHLMEYLTFFRKYTLWNISLSLHRTSHVINYVKMKQRCARRFSRLYLLSFFFIILGLV
jgi:hypothetical protein